MSKHINHSSQRIISQDKGFVMCKMYSKYYYSIRIMGELIPFFDMVMLLFFKTKFLDYHILRRIKHFMERYVKTISIHAGLGDRRWMLESEIISALIREMIPILSPPALHRDHNNSKLCLSSWHKYYDMKNIYVNIYDTKGNLLGKEHVKIITLEQYIWKKFFHKWRVKKKTKLHILKRSPNIGLFHPQLKSELINHHLRYEVVIKASKEVRYRAMKIAKRLGKFYLLKVRRGDFLTHPNPKLKEHTEKYTKPSAILSTINPIIPKGARIYIMTDEKDPNYFNLLREHYEIFQFFDFRALKRILKGPYANNFFLYAIESELKKYALHFISIGPPRTQRFKDLTFK